MERETKDDRRRRRDIDLAAKAYFDSVHRTGHLNQPVNPDHPQFRAWADLNAVDRANLEAVATKVAELAAECWKCRLSPYGVLGDQALREKRAIRANSSRGEREIRELRAATAHLPPGEARQKMIDKLGFIPGSNYDDDFMRESEVYADEDYEDDDNNDQ